VVGEKLQRACGLNIWFEWDPTKACSTGDAGSFIVRRVVRAVWQKKPKAEWVRVAKVRGGSGGVGACKKACIGRAGKSGYGTDMGIIEMRMATAKDGNVLAEPKA